MNKKQRKAFTVVLSGEDFAILDGLAELEDRTCEQQAKHMLGELLRVTSTALAPRLQDVPIAPHQEDSINKILGDHEPS